MGQTPDTRPGSYYVSVVAGPRYRLLAGPYDRHADAIAAVDRAAALAKEIDPGAIWYAYGTCRIPPGHPTPAGILNGRMGIRLQ
jgi:hypothetical protein